MADWHGGNLRSIRRGWRRRGDVKICLHQAEQALLANPPAKRRRIRRRADERALRRVAAKRQQALLDLFAFDALGDDPQAEIVREIDRGADNHLVLAAE